MRKENFKLCLLGASFGTNNLGVNVLTAGTLQAFYKEFPGGELFLFDYGKKGETYRFQAGAGEVPVELVPIRFSKKAWLKNNIAYLIALAVLVKCIPSRRIRANMIGRNKSLRRMAEADVVASMAGGDSFSDIYGTGRFVYVALPQILAVVMGKRLVLLPQTIGPFKGKLVARIAAFIMKRAEIVYARDRKSLTEAGKLVKPKDGESGNLRFSHDVGFILDPVEPSRVDGEGFDLPGDEVPLVGINVSGLLYMGGYSRNNMFGLKTDYRELVHDLIDFMVRKKNARVLLVPHVFGAHDESDSVVCSQIHDSLKDRYGERLLSVGGSYNQSEIKHLIGHCDFFVGARMHACIAALSQHIPTISVAYSRKFAGVMKTIGVEELVADPRELEKETIIAIIDDAFERRESLRRHLEKVMPDVRKGVYGLFGDISARVGEGLP